MMEREEEKHTAKMNEEYGGLTTLSNGDQAGIVVFFVGSPLLAGAVEMLGWGEPGFIVAVITAGVLGLGGKYVLDKNNPQISIPIIEQFRHADWGALIRPVVEEEMIEGEIEEQGDPSASSESQEDEEPLSATRRRIIPPGQGKAPPGQGKPIFPEYPQDQTLRLGTVAATGQRFDPPINDLLGKGLLVAGSPGAGKSNLAAVICEQAGGCRMSCIIFDFKREYHTLVQTVPNGVRAGHSSYAGKAGTGWYH